MKIVIAPKIQGDPPSGQLEQLASLLREVDPAVPATVSAAEPMMGHGVTLQQVISVWIPWDKITAVAVGAVIMKVVEWMRARRAESPSRPRTVTLYGPNGEPLKLITVSPDAPDPIVRDPNPAGPPEKKHP